MNCICAAKISAAQTNGVTDNGDSRLLRKASTPAASNRVTPSPTIKANTAAKYSKIVILLAYAPVC